MKHNVQHLLEQSQPQFNVIEEFSRLTAQRKMLLCDHLFSESYQAYQNMAALLWPQIEEHDLKKLEKFLMLLKQAAH